MQTQRPRVFTEIRYLEAAQEYLRNLPPEHFMETIPQATQREVTLASLALLRADREDVHVYNELLLQYPLGEDRIGQVVPDNMLVVWAGEIRAVGSYDVPLQPVGPFLVMEYVSPSSRRKDYGESFRKYEQELKVPYYLLFVPDVQEMNLFVRREARGWNGRRAKARSPAARTGGRRAVGA
jgi:Uma2 family endonuclease